MRPFPPGLSVARTATPLTFVSILGLRGATPVPELFAFWRCPLRLLGDLHALACRSCESPECELAAGAGLLDFSCWRALEPSLEVLQRRWLCMGPCTCLHASVCGRLCFCCSRLREALGDGTC